MNTVLRDIAALFYIVPFQAEVNYVTPDDVPDYISRAVPYFLLMILLEFIYGVYLKHKLYSLKDAVMSISLGIVQQLLGIWLKEALIFPYLLVYQLFAPIRQIILESSYWLQISGTQYDLLLFIIGFLGCDLGYYFLHRTAHEWQLLWSAHSVHHSGERYNFATALRQGAFQSTYSWFFYIPLAILGLPVTHFIRHNRLNTIYQFWIHTEIIGRLPWILELIMNTASHHRLHHRPPGNCNYAGVLIIWDRLFCTFQSERHMLSTTVLLSSTDINNKNTNTNTTQEDSSVQRTGSSSNINTTRRGVIYGLAKPLNNYDPVYANMCHLLRLMEDKGTSEGAVEEKDGEDAAWVITRIIRLFTIIITKRIKQNLRLTLSPEELFPDIIEDWRIARVNIKNIYQKHGVPYRIAYIMHIWSELWIMPPPLDENNLYDSSYPGAISTNITDNDMNNTTNSTSTCSTIPTTTTTTTGIAVYSNRDITFLRGRQHREEPSLSLTYSIIVCVQFLLALIIGYSVLLQQSSKNKSDLTLSEGRNTTYTTSSSTSSSDITAICNALVCIGCVLLLQTIKFYYK